MASKIVCFHKLHLKFVYWLAYVIGKQQEFHKGLQRTGLVLSVPWLPNLSRHKDLLGQSPTHTFFWNSNLIHFQTAVTERIACTLLNYFSLLIRYWGLTARDFLCLMLGKVVQQHGTTQWKGQRSTNCQLSLFSYAVSVI